MKRGIITIVSMLACAGLSAQTTYDAVNTIEQELIGTARYIGMGGAMSAFGNDISTISTNPAGIGTYTTNEVNFTGSFYGTKTAMGNTSMQANSVSNMEWYSKNAKSGIKASADVLSFVLFNRVGGNSALKSVNFGFSYRKLNNTDRALTYYDSFADQDGYQVYRDFESNIINRIKSYDLNVALNFNNKFYLGYTLEMLSSSYSSTGYFYDYYPEQPGFDAVTDYHSADMMTAQYATGYNMALGMIYRPFKGVRFGLSVKTPNWFGAEIDYADYLYAFEGELKDGEKFSQYSSYRFTSPWTLNASTGITLGKTALGVEYEHNFANSVMLLDENRVYLDDQGDFDFQDYGTWRAGLEQNIGKFSLRAGYSYTSPMFGKESYKFTGDTDFNNNRMDFQTERHDGTRNLTCGLGYCATVGENGQQFYVDMAYVNTLRKSLFSLSEYDDDPVLGYEDKTNRVLISLGCTF